jgi:fido (protein-threonine AMPylation protein)
MPYIWPPQTGITDYDGDPKKLAASELEGIRAIWTEQKKRLAGTKQLSDFTDRLARDWAIETGIIENLYDIERGVTQTLIERGFQAELLSHGTTNKPREFVLQMLRDQQDALEGVFAFVRQERPLSVSYVKELHAALLRSQSTTEAYDTFGSQIEVLLIRGDWKRQPNSPVRDGQTFEYCPPEHVASEMDRLIELHATHSKANVPAEVEAAWLHHRFSQVHPFQDGNGRVARALASLVLIKAGLFPLVITRDERHAYIEALEKADAGDLGPLVSMFAKLQRHQFLKASAISEAVLAEDTDVKALLGGLKDAARHKAKERQLALQKVFDRARDIENDIVTRLQGIVPDVQEALAQVDDQSNVFATHATERNSHYYKAQIISIAKNYLNYYVDTSEYRSWVALQMHWERKAVLAFAVHGFGREFNGSLICAPFLEFRDSDSDGETSSTVVPITSEGFVFFYNDTKEQLLKRFRPWREAVIKVALRELIDNL